MLNSRKKTIIYVVCSILYLTIVFVYGTIMTPENYAVDYTQKFMEPGVTHLFGTDFMGRDMFYRCIKGLSLSMWVGFFASIVSSFISLIFGISSAVIGGKFDRFINWCVDLCMGMPHLILLILISYMLGKGAKGVAIGVAITHWPELTRIVRAEVLQLKSSQYVQLAYKMGYSRFYVAVKHMLPHVIPAYLIGLILLFPHAIMHEASITFLGFGISSEQPAIGVILAESLKHIATGKWWLAVFPGIMLLTVVILFDVIGENLKRMLDPANGNK